MYKVVGSIPSTENKQKAKIHFSRDSLRRLRQKEMTPGLQLWKQKHSYGDYCQGP
jgi:hypothetical protein